MFNQMMSRYVIDRSQRKKCTALDEVFKVKREKLPLVKRPRAFKSDSNYQRILSLTPDTLHFQPRPFILCQAYINTVHIQSTKYTYKTLFRQQLPELKKPKIVLKMLVNRLKMQTMKPLISILKSRPWKFQIFLQFSMMPVLTDYQVNI